MRGAIFAAFLFLTSSACAYACETTGFLDSAAFASRIVHGRIVQVRKSGRIRIAPIQVLQGPPLASPVQVDASAFWQAGLSGRFKPGTEWVFSLQPNPDRSRSKVPYLDPCVEGPLRVSKERRVELSEGESSRRITLDLLRKELRGRSTRPKAMVPVVQAANTASGDKKDRAPLVLQGTLEKDGFGYQLVSPSPVADQLATIPQDDPLKQALASDPSLPVVDVSSAGLPLFSSLGKQIRFHGRLGSCQDEPLCPDGKKVVFLLEKID